MKAMRVKFGQRVLQIAGGFGGGGPGMAAGPSPDLVALIVWACLFVLLLFISLVIPNWLASFSAQVCLAILWGAFLGLTILFFFHQKVIMTAVGGFIGVGVSNLAGVAQVVEKLAEGINAITVSINSALGGEVVIYNSPGWVFLFCLSVPCLLAYR
jgi:hypothetical protein